MQLKDYIIITTCVIIMTLGQLMFKQVAVNYNKFGLWDWHVYGLLFVACGLYVTSTGLWIWALRTVAISKAYPFFALGFVMVPLVGVLFFKEIVTVKYMMGAVLIVLGVVLTAG